MWKKGAVALIVSLLPASVWAAGVDGAALGLGWVLPFAAILLSIATIPMVAPGVWHHHFGKIVALWTLCFLLPFTGAYGVSATASIVLHALLTEYVPFIVLLFSLYTVAGGILFWGTLTPSPRLNSHLLLVGTLLASVMGTTGASMLLIRPLLRANEKRHYRQHVVVFFIFLVANIGGGLTPLGDPPLFLGFLKGVSFAWTFTHMLLPVCLATLILLLAFYGLDSYLFRKEAALGQLNSDKQPQEPHQPLKLYGGFNFVLLLGMIGAVILSGVWKPGVMLSVLGQTLALQDVVRDGLLLGLAGVSWWLTPRQVRAGNEFNWAPIIEVAKLFAGIFITIAPVIAILHVGPHGKLGFVADLVTNHAGEPSTLRYFWVTGILSSFLDNAPTYLVFFNLASGQPDIMMTSMAQVLLAISMGAVFMGANTYIGNAPNFMVKAIAEQRGVRMPGFFSYMLWSVVFLVPTFILVSWWVLV